jgi:hypothetical protein
MIVRRAIQVLGVLFIGLALYTFVLGLQLGLLYMATPAHAAKTAQGDLQIEFAVAYLGIGIALLAAARR